MKKKILHVPNYYPPHIGGIEGVCYSIVTALPEYEHQVICFNDQEQTEKELYEGVPVTRCGVWKKLFSQSLSFSYYKELRRVFKTFQPDFVHFHTPNPLGSVYLLLALPRKTKLLLHWHSDIIEQNLLYIFYFFIELLLQWRAHKIMPTSPDYIEGSRVLKLWRKKLTVIPNTVDTNRWKKREEDDEAIERIRKLYDKRIIIFTCGRHVPYKGLRYLIEAARLVFDDAAIVIGGQGPLTEKLKKKAALMKNIHFTGRLSDDELRQYLYASDIYAFPSITRNEAFGVALAEAMYCGLASATFTIPFSGVNWLCLNRITCLEARNRDSKHFSEALNFILVADDYRGKLGEMAKKRINGYFTIEAIREQLEKLYS